MGLGNAISDSHLVVYYPPMLVLLAYGGRGIGRGMMKFMQTKYEGFHQRMITADRAAIGCYEELGFERAVKT